MAESYNLLAAFCLKRAKYSVPWSEINDRRNIVAEEGLAVYCAAQKPGELVGITEYVGISIAFVYIQGDRFTREIGGSLSLTLTKPPDIIRQSSRSPVPTNRLKRALEWSQKAPLKSLLICDARITYRVNPWTTNILSHSWLARSYRFRN